MEEDALGWSNDDWNDDTVDAERMSGYSPFPPPPLPHHLILETTFGGSNTATPPLPPPPSEHQVLWPSASLPTHMQKGMLPDSFTSPTAGTYDSDQEVEIIMRGRLGYEPNDDDDDVENTRHLPPPPKV